jgi:peptidyl-prolyl cis-trans isomerase C
MVCISGCSKDKGGIGDKKGFAPKGDGKVIAQVGDDAILDTDLEALLFKIPPEFRARYETPEAQREIVDSLVKVKTLAWEAKRQGIDKKPEIQVSIKYFTDQLLANELQMKVSSDIKVSDGEISKYYKEHKDEFTIKQRIKARHILVNTEAEAKDILKKLKAGADFAALAKEKSKCPSAQRGGDLGWMQKGRMEPAFDEAAFSLKSGKLSGVVKTSKGYHIIKVEDVRPEKIRELDKVKASIEKKVAQEKREKALTGLIDEVKKNVKVEINESYFKSLAKEKKE